MSLPYIGMKQMKIWVDLQMQDTLKETHRKEANQLIDFIMVIIKGGTNDDDQLGMMR